MRTDGTIHGRGAADNPPNRFEHARHERDPDEDVEPEPAPNTQFLADASRTIIATNDSPDVGFEASINPYRGCEHGCIYCYARPTHEYLGFSAGLDFETKIMVKERAPELLRRALAAPGWRPKPLALSGVTDPYQPVERRLRLTRRCLEVLAEFRNPVVVITKNRLVVRDADLLGALARFDASAVFLSITTLDAALARALEPRTSTPSARLGAIAALAGAGVPVGVLVAPLIPGLTDHELPAIVAASAEAGATFAGYTPLRLPLAVAPLFEDWLERHAPRRKARVLGRIRALRGGRLNDARFGARMRGQGPFADLIAQLFAAACRDAGLGGRALNLSTAAFRRPGAEVQPRLPFD
jgi:DNA repair photolyase